METEITVLVKSTYDDLKKRLEQNGFTIQEEYLLKLVKSLMDYSKY